MTVTGRLLKWILWLTGGALLLALVGVFMPYSLMQASHDHIGMGELPALPVIDYLARSTSAFYALLGGLCFVLARDPRRHRAVLLYLGAVTVICSIGITVVDFHLDLPWWWTWGEGPATLLLGIAVWWLAAVLPREGTGGPAP